MPNANRYSDDQLQNFIDRVRGEGVWCDTSVHDSISHKFVSRNPRSTVAISLCGSIVKPFEKLHENTITKRCLVCDMFDFRGKEANGNLYQKLAQIADQNETDQPTE